MAESSKRTLRSRFNRASSSSMHFASKDRLTSFANMVNIFMGTTTTSSGVGSPRTSMERNKLIANNEVRVRKSAHMKKRNH